MPLLEVRELTKHFGGLFAVEKLDFTIEEGQIVGLIGPNGAGKSTVLNLISGVLKPTNGVIFFGQKNIVGFRPDQVAKKGIVRTFQANVLFKEFTVLDNILMGFHLNARLPFWGQLFSTMKAGQRQRTLEKRAMEILEFLELISLKQELAMNIPGGYQRLLGIGIALGAQAKLLLLDEPFTGMTEAETFKAMGIIDKVRKEGTTILLVEHNMQAVMDLCEKLVVINFGRKLTEGPCEEVKENKDVIEAYLGIEENAV